MLFSVEASSPVPIYAQVVAQVRAAIAAGELRAGDALPSVRQLAAELRVNPNTVVQAYRELEHEGLTYVQRGQGTIVGISSVAGNRGRQSNYIYGSAKAALTAYLSGLRNKMYHHKVHVLTVLPGFVNTKMTEHLKLPKPLTAQPEEVANAVYDGVKKKKNIIYVKWFWRSIMTIITSIPEPMFKKKKL